MSSDEPGFKLQYVQVQGTQLSKNSILPSKMFETTKIQDIYTFLTKIWGFPEPKIIISINGSSKEPLHLSEKERSLLKISLENISDRKVTWIITDGIDKGIAKLIGEINVGLLNSRKDKLRIIGIDKWENNDNEIKINSNEEGAETVVTINNNNEMKIRLNKNHHAYIYCSDNPSICRVDFEIDIMEKSKAKLFQILVGGDETTNTLLEETIKKNFLSNSVKDNNGETQNTKKQNGNKPNEENQNGDLQNKEIRMCCFTLLPNEFIPNPLTETLRNSKSKSSVDSNESDKENEKNKMSFILILKGSGGFADKICSYIETETKIESNEKDEIKHKEYDEWIDKMKTNSKDSFMEKIIIYNINLSNGDLTSEIVRYLIEDLKRDVLKNENQEKKVEKGEESKKLFEWQIDFDYANSIDSIFYEQMDIKNKQKDFICILNNSRIGILKYFFTELDVHALINEALIKNLYKIEEKEEENSLNENCFKINVLFKDCKDKNDLFSIGNLIKMISKNTVNNIFPDTKNSNANSQILRLNNKTSPLPGNEKDNKKYYIYIFVWALLTQRFEVAQILWQNGEHHTRTALIGSVICNQMMLRAKAKCQIELLTELRNLKHFYEKQAIDIVRMAHTEDKDKIKTILTKKFSKEEPDSCLEIARKNTLNEFLSQSTCQSIVNKIWFGEKPLSLNPFIILLNVPFGLITSPCVFHRRRLKENCQNSGNGSKDNQNLDNTKSDKNNSNGKFHCGKAIMLFYQAPVTKFTMNYMAYVAFLTIFSYFMLVELNTISVSLVPFARKTEYVVYIFVISMFLEEIRQFWGETFSNWKLSLWNWFDISIYFVFLLAFILRQTVEDKDFIYCRTAYALSLSMFFIRFMQFYYVAESIGPKIIMLQEMMKNMGFFMAIYLIVLLAFGTFSVSLLYPNLSINDSLLKNIIYTPFWQLFGTLDLNYMSGVCDSSKCTPNTLVIVANAFFLLFVNVMLINLLIAIFGNTVNHIESKAYYIWAQINYQIVDEFTNRPILPPPFNVFELLWWLYKKINCKTNEEEEGNNGLSGNKDLIQLEKNSLEKCRYKGYEFGSADVFEPSMKEEDFFEIKSLFINHNSSEQNIENLRESIDTFRRQVEDGMKTISQKVDTVINKRTSDKQNCEMFKEIIENLKKTSDIQNCETFKEVIENLKKTNEFINNISNWNVELSLDERKSENLATNSAGEYVVQFTLSSAVRYIGEIRNTIQNMSKEIQEIHQVVKDNKI